MLRDKTKKQKGKEGSPESVENPSLFDAKPDPAIVRLLTPYEQWTPAQKRADKRAEDAARAQGLVFYQQVQALLKAGDLAGAVRAINPFPSGHYYSEAVQAVALAQVQAGELLAAVANAQWLPHADTKANVLGAVIQVLLQRGDLTGAQWLAATVTGFRAVEILKQLAEAQQQAGHAEAARYTLVQARERAQGFDKGDMKNGYFRSYYLTNIVEAQLRLDDVAGATQTAQLIDEPEYQDQAARAINER